MTSVAISGFGSIGRQHARALRESTTAQAIIFEPTPAIAEQARSLGNTVVSDFTEMLDMNPDALVIAGPDHVHLEQLVAAAEAGIPTLVEKPVAPSLADTVPVVDRLRAAGTPILVGYVLHHRLIFTKAAELLAAKVIGEPVSVQVMLGAYGTITAAANRFDSPESDRLYRDYSHEWDYLRWFFGPIDRALAVARTIDGPAHIESPNVVDGLLGFANGMVGAVHLDYVEPVGTRTVHVVGTGGSLRLDAGRHEIVLRTAGTDHERRYAYPENASAGLGRQLQHLLAVARGEVEPAVSLDDGLAALAVTEAVRASAVSESWVQVR